MSATAHVLHPSESQGLGELGETRAPKTYPMERLELVWSVVLAFATTVAEERRASEDDAFTSYMVRDDSLGSFERRRSSIPAPAESRTPTWHFWFTEECKRNLQRLDKKLQGRVLEAIMELFESPLHAHGDTVKPLGGELKGVWRYRIGDYRLLYRPDAAHRVIAFISCVPRGEAYDD